MVYFAEIGSYAETYAIVAGATAETTRVKAMAEVRRMGEHAADFLWVKIYRITNEYEIEFVE